MAAETIDIKNQLVRNLEGEYLKGFYFSLEEGETETVASLTNSALRKFIILEDSATNVIVRYVLVKNLESSSDKIYKLEIVKSGTELSFVSTEIATGKIVNKIMIPSPVDHKSHDNHTFDTIGECIAEFDSSDLQSRLQAEANRTCENQVTHVTCCLTGGSCWSVVLIIKPSSWKCRFSIALPDTGRFALKDS